MKTLYQKSELTFALVWIGIYCIFLSIGDNLSNSLGTEKIVTLPICVLLSLVLYIFLKRNNLTQKYGLCKSVIPCRKMLFYIPLALTVCVNLFYGIGTNLSPTETVLYILSMLFVGFLEEIIFRGLLFKAMSKDSMKSAVIVSSITFGMGHIINLFNGSGDKLFSNLLQIIYATAIGFLFVIIFIKTQSLYSAILTHSFTNALSVFANSDAMTFQKEIFSAVFLVCVSLLYSFYIIRNYKTQSQ